jgi:4-amino-4-deoxy-L-arabinose transferase-like glycosyltransferase
MHHLASEAVRPVPDRASAAGTRSVLAWLPFLWDRVLFPGDAPPSARCRWTAFLLLLLVPAALLYPWLSFHLFEPDEGRYAEIPREMLARGEWVVPYLLGEPYLDKPPLFYWLVMLSYRFLGIHDWSARLVPALAVHGCVLLTYGLGRRLLGERAAFRGALTLGLAPGFVSVGRLLVLDGLLTFWVTLALFAVFEAVRGERLRWGWWLLAALACGLGILTKGPVTLLLVLPPLWLYRLLTGRGCQLRFRDNLAFVIGVLAVALPWYLAICVQQPSFAGYFLWEHNVVRFLSPFDHLRPIWFYGPILLGGLLPGTILAIPFILFLLSGDAAAAQRRCSELGFILLAGAWCVLFFSLSGSKLPTYILPAFPPLALALGYYLTGSRWERSWVTSGVAGVTVVLLSVGHALVLPWYAWHHSPMGRPEEVRRLCADPQTPVVCYPRNLDSVAFYLGRDDLRSYRSKDTPTLIDFMTGQPRTVILFAHRHSLDALRQVLPPQLHLTSVTPLFGSAKLGPQGMCYMAAVERANGQETPAP